MWPLYGDFVIVDLQYFMLDKNLHLIFFNEHLLVEILRTPMKILYLMHSDASDIFQESIFCVGTGPS